MPREVYRNIVFTLAALYFFLSSIVLIKESVTSFAEVLAKYLLYIVNDTTGGVFAGWLGTALLQSSGAFDSIIITFASTGIVPVSIAAATLIGAEVGTTVTTILVSVAGYVRRTRGEFESTFRVSMLHFWYNFFVLLIFYPIELVTGMFTHLANAGADIFTMFHGLYAIPSVLDAATPWVPLLLGLIPAWLGFILGITVLLLSLMLSEKYMTATFSMPRSWNLLRATFTKPLRSFLAGFVFTIFVPSTSVMVSLLVPLVAGGVLRPDYRLLPYILGANVGTVFDVLMAALAVGNPVAMGVWLVHLSLNLLGAAIFLPLTNPLTHFVEKITGFLTKSKARAIAFVVVFHVIPVTAIVLDLLV